MSYFPGIKDEDFIRGDIPMTKQEVRILVLTKAKICPTDTIIDIGAGTGSLSIEAALQASSGKVYAIERHPEGAQLIRSNAIHFGADNIEVISGSAPEALQGLPIADVIFIGGSGGHLQELLAQSNSLLKPNGRLVITAITIETLYDALHSMQAKPEFTVEAFGMQVTRIKQVKSSNMLQALNPIYIIICTKGI
ncbi:precorrin-6Y C5,15-methyltransferase (decarboxylating) subunit CbiT [Pelosinus sp. UFO1]|uniref:precorrin-6Y C5,15-methyltransferase (decarboxylating) subunit CbiT n=1 Tax=Pelosinus sp. UFO1 TaxID=484770 RepID=UPI0004D1C490|nr:precorrin-6Y C5,15-methyltransferase (decarboxylating) subunit CbiT [Pelosinus sp. UFO1]AIF51766.1 precorrin-6Y C5,15-methyltransferase (decarboxylating), CbiT subunit [Pelosinus sp. UFO1]